MNINSLLSSIIEQSGWSIKTASLMILANLIAIAIGRYGIKIRGLGPSIPLSGTEGFGLPELLATTSLGHILGCGIILGLDRLGMIW
uniref:Photosystem I reaction center subunit PsaK n=1 Tax=Apophlaea sinclairii TaxID=212746 RepID=A0A1C9CBM3_9FLOR|nr:photosystem I subunit X [Apophlaea sinclairii]AOM65759.1 photosystem I subunit X [Apophlaea sinclairii]